jgi:hypothetical protein
MPDDLIIVVGKRKVRWEPAVEEPAPTPSLEEFQASLPGPDPKPDIIVTSEVSQILVEGKRAYKKRTGNGHKSEKVRDLIDSERHLIRNYLFIPKNGQIEDDDCVVFKNNVSELNEIAIFQITGFISVLHTRVAEGGLQVNDLVAYESWMRTKYGETLWARYNLPLYVKTRAINATLISQGQTPVKAKEAQSMHDVALEAIEELSTVKPSTTPKFTSFRKRFAGA